MLSPYRNNPINTNKRTKKTSNTNCNNDLQRDLKRPQLTSNDLKRPQSTSNEIVKSSKNKKTNIVKAGSVHHNVEIDEH